MPSIQVIGLSATLPNIDAFCTWFSASLFVTHYRPISLSEYYCIQDSVFDRQGKVVFIPNSHGFPF